MAMLYFGVYSGLILIRYLKQLILFYKSNVQIKIIHNFHAIPILYP